MKNNEIVTNSIMKIWLEENINTHPFISRDYWEKNFNLVKNFYIPNSETFYYEENDKIVGFISILNNTMNNRNIEQSTIIKKDKEEQNREKIKKRKKEGYIGALFISSKYQRQGIGKYFINKSKKRYNKLSLAVYIQNTNAISFYEKNGFKVICKQKNSDTQEEEYLMKWEK